MPRPLGEPRSHQRRWREFNVDENLKDQWLESINDLNNLKVVSTCEGHTNDLRGSSLPHVNLTIKSIVDYCSYDELHINLFKDLLDEFDTNNFNSSIELSMKVSQSYNNRNKIIFRIFSKIRNTQENNTLINNWWNELIKTLIKINSILETKKNRLS